MVLYRLSRFLDVIRDVVFSGGDEASMAAGSFGKTETYRQLEGEGRKSES